MKTIVITIALAITGCGGTFVLSPDGSVSYTTPQIIKPSSK